jgi:hypothetical protein
VDIVETVVITLPRIATFPPTSRIGGATVSAVVMTTEMTGMWAPPGPERSGLGSSVALAWARSSAHGTGDGNDEKPGHQGVASFLSSAGGQLLRATSLSDNGAAGVFLAPRNFPRLTGHS